MAAKERRNKLLRPITSLGDVIEGVLTMGRIWCNMCTGRKQGQKWPKKGKKTMNYTQCGSALALPYADGIAQTCVTSPIDNPPY